VATAQITLQITGNQQLVQFAESDFNLQIDSDNDGVFNAIERESRTDPLSADSGQTPAAGPSCTALDLAAGMVTAGSVVTQSVSGAVDCGDDNFELEASAFGFMSNSADNTIQWNVPSTAVAGDQLSFSVDVVNPANPGDIFASFEVNATVIPVSTCDALPTISEFTSIRDLHVQGTDVFNQTQLRIDSNDRRALLGFSIPAGSVLTGNATLTITVGNDEGSGTVNVSQLESFQWSEAADTLQLPESDIALGALTTDWLIGQQNQFALTGLTSDGQSDPQNSIELTLLLTQVSGSDTAFLARESGTPAILSVEFAGNCDNQ